MEETKWVKLKQSMEMLWKNTKDVYEKTMTYLDEQLVPVRKSSLFVSMVLCLLVALITL